MKVRSTLVALAIVIAGCGGTSNPPRASSSAAETPASSPSAGATASPSASTTPSSAPSPTLVHCSSPVPAGDNLVIGTVSGDSTVVIRDIQDPAHARNLCRFDATAFNPQFVTASKVAYVTGAGQLVGADLASGTITQLANPGGGFAPGLYSVSPDGSAETYLNGDGWHLVNAGVDRLLATLPPVPGRGVNPDEDDTFLRYSPDGKYIALFQTFRTGGSGNTAPDQIRKAGDGSLVYSTSNVTMAVWASVPSRLFFRDSAGSMKRWDASTGVSTMMSLHWIRPKASPDGRWIAYTIRPPGALGRVGLYGVQSNSVAHNSALGRSGAWMISNDLVWYVGEKACSTCFGGQPTPTGITYLYDIAGASEVQSRLTSVLDAWPHTTAPGL
jgi:Tol biopolymer transport system component